MKGREKVNDEITLTFEHLREIIDNPELLNDIPNGSAVVFIDKYEPLPKRKTTPSGEPIKYIRVKKKFEAAA